MAEMFDTERVVPVGIFLHGGERPESLTLGGDHYRFLHFRYLACTLNALPWEDWRDSDNLVARLNLPNMRYRRSERVAVYACATRGLMELEPDLEKRLKYADFIDIYAGLTDAERQQYQHDYPEEAKIMQSFSTRFRDEGIRIGEANVVLYQLEQKFGSIPDEFRERVQHADSDTLLRWSGKLLTGDTIDEVLQ